MGKKILTVGEFFEGLREHITVADVLAADAISDVSVAILNKRLEFQMTQKAFAKHLGVSQGMISKWENGDYNFTLRSIAEICEKLDLQMKLKIDKYLTIGKNEWSYGFNKQNRKELKQAKAMSELFVA